MEFGVEVARLRALSDGELISSLNGSLRASRRSVAEVVAHLGEVEERRLHWISGYSSMFDYCSSRLGMSADEAYRRIEAARLARRFPEVLAKLACGHISLSVAVLLKPHLTDGNLEQLLDEVAGKTVRQAREVLAGWFPRPDVPSSMRKLPERQKAESQATTRARPGARHLTSSSRSRPSDIASSSPSVAISNASSSWRATFCVTHYRAAMWLPSSNELSMFCSSRP